ncbi:hypothetical protein GS493_11945 [Rhodococcus hoagii]|nr:hypothetical protein [Prescottella equi]
MHALFHALPNPVFSRSGSAVRFSARSALWGGPATLFKDAENMGRATASAADESVGRPRALRADHSSCAARRVQLRLRGGGRSRPYSWA